MMGKYQKSILEKKVIPVFVPFVIFFLLISIHTCQAEIAFSGFISVGAGQVISNNSRNNTDIFIADYAHGGEYQHDTTYLADTTAGVQAQSDLLEGIFIKTQIIGHGSDGFNAELDSLYLSYEFQPKRFLDVGRKRLPHHYFSEFFDIGHSYIWIRPPVNSYTWQINHFNGASLRQDLDIETYSSNITLFYGREESEDNPILGKLFNANVDETWRDMLGAVVGLSRAWWDVRLHYLNGRNDRVIYDYRLFNGYIVEVDNKQKSFENYDFTHYGISINLETENLFLLTEYTIRNRERDPQIQTYLVTVGARWKTLSWHVTYSEFDQQKVSKIEKAEEHNTKSTGIRWDLYPKAALKFQYDRFDNTGGTAYLVGGDSETLSMAVDMVF